MRVIEPYHLKPNKASKRHKFKFSRVAIIVIIIVLLITGSLGVISYIQPLPVVRADAVTLSTVAAEVKLAWPDASQASIGALGYGVLEDNGRQKPFPTASIAKVMTALSVLRQYPLKPGELGPVLTITQADVDLYNSYLSKDGSVVEVKLGEKITEYQALEAMLLPSANNMADTLANWAFGSVKNYTSYASKLANSIGMKQTTISDASGFSPQTKSTSHDLVLLGQAALRSPVLSTITAEKKASLPVVGKVNNVNYLLGQDGIVGIKTGNTDQAGGCYLFAANRTIGPGSQITIIGAIIGAKDLVTAIASAKPLLESSYAGFKTQTIVRAGQVVGYYTSPWGQVVQAVAESNLNVLGWAGQVQNAQVELDNISAPSASKKSVGSIEIAGEASSVTLKNELTLPNWRWRLTRGL